MIHDGVWVVRAVDEEKEVATLGFVRVTYVIHENNRGIWVGCCFDAPTIYPHIRIDGASASAEGLATCSIELGVGLFVEAKSVFDYVFEG